MVNKAQIVELSAVELIAAASGRIVTGINPIENHDKVSNILKTMQGYEYDKEKLLTENIYAAFPQYKLKEATDEFSALMQKWIDRGDDLSFIDNSMNAKIIASSLNIPQTLHVKVNKEEVKAKESVETKDEKQAKSEAKYTSTYSSISDWKHRHIWGD